MSHPQPPRTPCSSCPWRIDQNAGDIPHFSLALAERLKATCPDERDMGPDFGASMFACHQSSVGHEVHCAGWLASVGHRHPSVRLAVAQGRMDISRLRPAAHWPELHANYGEVLEKLRRTAPDNPEARACTAAARPRRVDMP